MSESKQVDDPEGITTLIVERVQGAGGVVNVQWRLNAEAAYDFFDPVAGTLLFSQVININDIPACLIAYWCRLLITFANS